MRIAILTIVAIVSLASLSVVAQSSKTSSIDKAVSFYQHNDYRQAASLLESLTKGQEANNAIAHYYLANSLYRLGNRSEAKYHYEIVLKLSPKGQIATFANEALSGLQSSSPKLKTIRESAQESTPTTNPAETPATLTPLEKQLVSVFWQDSDTPYALDQVAQAMHRVPSAIKQLLLSKNIKVIITPSLTDAVPEYRGQSPAEYIHGGTYENCAGQYMPDKKILYVAERTSLGNAPPTLNSNIIDIVLHELGHAVDDASGYPSTSESFRQMYTDDNIRLTNSQSDRFYYYSKQSRGNVELFAQLFAIALGSEEDAELATLYPKCFAYVSGLLKP